jgi:phage/plasmid-like protein (TIGR03299 family)
MNIERATMWANIGTDVSKAKNGTQLLKQAGLDFKVEKRPLYTMVDESYTTETAGGIHTKRIPVPNRSAIVDSTGHIHGVVGSRYTPIQNEDAFAFLDDMYSDGEFEFVKAGITPSDMVYVVAKLPETRVLGDKFEPHVILQNSHNGYYPFAAVEVPVRVFCQNQFNGLFKRHKESRILIRHTRSAEQRMKFLVELKRFNQNYFREFETFAIETSKQKVGDKRLRTIMKALFPEPEGDVKPAVIDRWEEQVNCFKQAYGADDNQNIKGTVYGVINAFADYATHRPYYRMGEGFADNLFAKAVSGELVPGRVLNVICGS